MAMLKEKDRKEIAEILKDLPSKVNLVYFTQELECEGCGITRELLTELATLSDRISLEMHDFVGEKEVADRYGIDKIPALLLEGDRDEGDRDRGIRFYGIPGGYEFASLLEDIQMVARGDSGLAPATRTALASLEKDVHLQVFVTPT
jgi:alkyl hydroperoxide reductase subunit AhpF